MTSKYLFKKIDGWQVIACSKAPGGHKTFVLQRAGLFKKKQVKLRDNALTALFTGRRTMKEYLAGKRFQCKFNIRVDKNSVVKI